MPVRGALQMSLARRRDRGLLVALIDSAGELRLLRAEQAGSLALVEAPAEAARPAIGVRVLTGGDRVIVLRDDHSLDLVDDSGARLARLEQRGFRPVAIAAAGRGLVALSLQRVATGHRAVLHRLDIAERSISLRPSTVEVAGPAGVSPSSWSVDPSGGVVAMLAMRPTTAFSYVVVADLERGTTEEVELPVQRGEEIAIGFVDGRNLIVSGRPNVGSWRIDVTRKNAMYPAVTPDDRDADLVSAIAPGTRATAVGAWLWVEAAGRDRVYLGYRPFLAEDAAISPDKRWVAWVSAGEIHMVGLRGQAAPRQLPAPDAMVQYRRVFFLDDRRLLLLDTAGQIEMVDWAAGAKLRSVDVGGVASDVQLDARRGLMSVLRPGGQVWVHRVSAAGGFADPLLIGDGATRMGFDDRDGHVLWTLDAANKLRTYSLADLERGMSRAEAAEHGTALPFNPREIDRQGRFFVQTPELRRLKGSQADAVDRSFPMVGSVARILPSPDGNRVAFVRSDGLISLFDGAREQPSWSRAFVDAAQSATWSQDGQLLAVATHSGSAVLDAATGNFVHLTCGPLFEVRRAPPLNLVPPAPKISLCEAGAASR